MTTPASRQNAALVAVLDALRCFEAEANAAAGAGAGGGAGGGAGVGGDAGGGAGVEGGAGVAGDADATGLSAAQLRVQALADLGVVKAEFEKIAVRQITAIERAGVVSPESDPVRAAGHRDVGSLLAESWRTSLANARQLQAVARATAPRYTLQGEELPPEFPVLAAALLGASGAGQIAAPAASVEQVAASVRELEKTACSLEQRSMGERILVEYAPGLTVEELRRLAIQVRDRLDADGTEPRDHIHRRRRSLTITTTRDGMTHIDWYLDPESAGHVLPAITAYVSADFRDTTTGVRFERNESTPETAVEAMPESRSLAQLRSDGAVDVFRHRAGCTTGATSPSVTMIVRVALADLREGKGSAHIDEVPTPISARSARRLAADAHLIPIVLGGNSEVLDLGRRERLFNAAQKLALAERDGGCAWTGCPHPPSYTQAHHIRWWDRDTGPTDLANGILLCSHHHHRVHDDGWGIQVRENIPWFTPPAHLDPTRTPRRGGRIRLPESAP